MGSDLEQQMSDTNDKQRSEAEELEREIRKQQAAAEIDNWLNRHLTAGGELQVVLLRCIKESELLLHNFEQPLVVLAAFCQRILDSDYLLKELARQADVEWGQVKGQRPYFEPEGSPPNPDDPYTFDSVRKTLAGISEQLAASE
jgi:hypothetical protein